MHYQFSDAPRTAPYNLYGPGNYQLDLAVVRSFPLHFSESAKLNFRAEMYNVTNHTQFAVASNAVGNPNFGTSHPKPDSTPARQRSSRHASSSKPLRLTINQNRRGCLTIGSLFSCLESREQLGARDRIDLGIDARKAH